MEARTCRVGVHGRNEMTWPDADYRLIREAKIETVKMMSFTDIGVFERLKAENPDIEVIVRLYSLRMSIGEHPSAGDFASEMIPLMTGLRPFATKFEVHNEPNHPARYEGWGPDNREARDFASWFIEVCKWLNLAHPWASLGFPGLAVPHRDIEWLKICRSAIEAADWLGCHCYWQTPPDQPDNHLHSAWGLRVEMYHALFPGKPIEITEFGSSNGQANPPLPLSEDDRARQYVEYYQELFGLHYIRSASAFIASSPDPQWEREGFVWAKSSDKLLPIVTAVGTMERPALLERPLADDESGDGE